MDAQIKKYKYDVTIEARVVSTEQKEDGIYKVEYEDAIFDAYSDNSRYYEGDTVYVHVPKGDFSQQKHIVGRKVDLDKEPEKTFKFKRPFDDFIQLDNLTYDDKDSLSVEHGYLANYPPHGMDNDAIDYSVELSNLTSELNQLRDKYNATIAEIEAYEIAIPEEITTINEGYTITDQYPDKSQQSYYSIIQDILSLNPHTLIELDDAIKQANAQLVIAAKVYQDEPLYINSAELTDIQAMMNAAKTRLINYIDTTYNNNATELQEEQAQYQDASDTQELSKEGNVNWLYTWRNKNNDPVLFTNLGVSIDVRTLLGNYRPQSGKYGLKLVIRGLTRPSEESATVSKVETVYFRNTEDFYGNTYAYYTPYTQQKLFNISNYLRIDRIDIYFWQDHNFLDETFTAIPYEDNSGNLYPANIIINNLTLSMGVDVNEFDVDKVFVYTYDDLYYGKDPYSGESRAEKDSRTLQFAWVHKLDDGSAELINTPEQLKEYNANIYWYHYDYGVAQDTTNYAERQGGINWDWLEEERTPALDENNEQILDENGKPVYNYNKFIIDVVPDISTAREQYRAILEYNQIPLRSDPLEMWNVDQSIVTATDDLTNEIVFRLLREDKDGNIVEDNTLGNFYVYDENNLCIYDDENIRYSDKWYYIQVWIRNNDTGAYLPLCIDDNPDSFEIEWTAPIDQMSMINQFVDVGDRDLDKAILMPTSASISANKNDNIRKVTKKFRIRNRWDLRYTENTMSAQITRNGRIYNLQKELFFGQSGSMGSEYTITIHQDTPNTPYMIQGKQFILFATVANQQGVEVPSAGYHFTWELLSPTIITNGEEDPLEDLTWQDSVWTTSNTPGYAGNCISGYIRNDLPPIFRVTMTGAAQYPISQTTGFKLTDSQSFNTKYVVSVPNRVEFKSDGKAPTTMTSNFWVAAINEVDGTVSKEIYPDWELVQYYKSSYSKVWNLLDEPDYFGLKESVQLKREIANNIENPVLYVELNTDDTIDYTARILNYDFSSTTILPEHKMSQMLYADICTLAESEYNAAIDTAREQYPDYTNNDEQQKLYQKAIDNAEQRYNTYIDKINYAAGKWVPECTHYALNPYINKNLSNSTAWAWDDLMLKNYYTYIGFESNGEDGIPYYIRQAIAMTRNEYSSSLVNSWDGSLLVDKENNAFLSKMVSAGSKDSDNRFTGVIMGDWADNGDTSIDDVGIYGFERGAQVFGLKTDGTGFIGKAGKGQIQFDGNYSLISNYDKSCYINLDPIKFNGLGALDERTTMGYSSYFLYARVPKVSTSSAIGETTLEGSTYWVTNFMNDTANDYFIVDPNNGILTTGGIIARYGKLGNWMISSDGLYQKSLNPETGKIDRYMYLGYKQKHAAEQYDANPELDENGEPIVFDINTIEDENYAIWCANSDNPYSIPYFAVDWDGTMHARKGYIGLKTPWEIDDYGLTQKNNFGMIYLGAPQKYLTNRNQTYDKTDFIMWSGPIMDITDTETDALMAGDAYFAILADGTIFSRRGQIGGWRISDKNLTSTWKNGAGQVRLNSEYGQLIFGENASTMDVSFDEDGNITYNPSANKTNFNILIDGYTGKIVLKHSDGLTTSGEIWIANYIIGSDTDSDITYPYIVSQDDTQDISTGWLGENGTATYKGGGTGGWSYDSTWSITINAPTTISSKTWSIDNNKSASYTLSKEKSDTLRLVTNNGDDRYIGAGAYLTSGFATRKNSTTGQTGTDAAVAFYPVGAGYNAATLGVDDAPWNLIGNYISANSVIAGAVIGTSMYCDNEQVATQPWVTKQLNSLWNAINSLGNGGSGLANGTAGMGQAGDAKAATHGEITSDDNDGTCKIILHLYSHNDTEVVTASSPSTLAAGLHTHSISLTLSGNKLTAKIGLGATGTQTDSSVTFNVGAVKTGRLGTNVLVRGTLQGSPYGNQIAIDAKEIYDDGYSTGYDKGKADGYSNGYNAGKSAGWDACYEYYYAYIMNG